MALLSAVFTLCPCLPGAERAMDDCCAGGELSMSGACCDQGDKPSASVVPTTVLVPAAVFTTLHPAVLEPASMVSVVAHSIPARPRVARTILRI